MTQHYIETIYLFLTACALRGDWTYYEEVASHAGLDLDQEAQRIMLYQAFSKINGGLHRSGHPMLTAVVSQKDAYLRDDPCPGPGFFKCARDELGYTVIDGSQFHAGQLRRVFAVQQWPNLTF